MKLFVFVVVVFLTQFTGCTIDDEKEREEKEINFKSINNKSLREKKKLLSKHKNFSKQIVIS